MTRTQVAEAFARWQALDPNPRTELHFDTPYQLLVAVVLSAQATDVGVNRVTRTLFKLAPTPEKMVRLGEAGIRPVIASLGLYNAKAANVAKLSAQLLALHGGEVPGERAALEALPGVGRKSANVVLNVVFGKPTLAVDTHIFRVANRMGLSLGATPLAVEQGLLKVIAPPYLMHAHHWLILHGRYVCTARKPRCDACAVADLCQWPDKPLQTKTSQLSQ